MNTYIDYLLRFDSEAEATSVLYTDEMPNYPAIDVIGIIYEPTGVIIDTPEGPEEEMAPIPGWHVNVRTTAEAPELNQYEVHPANPVRKWF